MTDARKFKAPYKPEVHQYWVTECDGGLQRVVVTKECDDGTYEAMTTDQEGIVCGYLNEIFRKIPKERFKYRFFVKHENLDELSVNPIAGAIMTLKDGSLSNPVQYSIPSDNTDFDRFHDGNGLIWEDDGEAVWDEEKSCVAVRTWPGEKKL